jgi:hypothetical protein
VSAPQIGDSETPEVEVRVHRVRRRRSEPSPLDRPRPPNLRSWVIYSGLVGLVALLMFEGYLRHKPKLLVLPTISETIGVRSVIIPVNDSLRVIVSWDLTLSTPEGRPDSVRVTVLSNAGRDSLVRSQAASFFADTVYLPAPASGKTLTGTSCVAAQHPGVPIIDNCTPWQYIRSEASSSAGVLPSQTVIIQPTGLQVDPDQGGKCAQWQRSHPGESVWIAVNRVAVRECTGANGKPTVAQFCAFVMLPGGRKAKPPGLNSRYCEELFVEWSRDRYS